ncbi:LysR family transcriptional regulator [Falsirhodobacter xinxiangensis]|uniref:LysR family transcriptional regulator n=1 Tax=Falsirhodobacter xinxiangensis TaxID=2530049 RepID=UPI0010AA1C2A|nr:LysR family transcriptional regulator [Rhodobacter xinxiangensis]
MGEIEDLRLFLAVAREGSFVGAARALGMTPPSVTRGIAALEDRLRVQLFVRTTRRVSLTSAGAAYAARIGPVVQDLQAATEELREQHGETAGMIRLTAPLAFGARLLPDLIAQFRVLYPAVSFSVALSDRFVDSIDDSFDLAIRISRPSREVLSIWRKICRVERAMAASPAYIAAAGLPNHPQDLATHSCIAHDSEAIAETWELTAGEKTHRVRAGSTMAGNNAALLAGLARNGQGIVLLPRFMLMDDLASGRLVQVLPGWSPPDLWLTLYYPPYDRLPARLTQFSDFVASNVELMGM